ncbi:MAG: M48 family metallopeptidase [Balneolales bacterium]
MDFFEAQDRARRITWKLIGLYLMAVFLIIASVYLVALALFGYSGQAPAGATLTQQLWQPELFTGVSIILIIIIVAGTLFRIAQLRKGGSAVAEMLGGRKLESSTRDFKERQLVNVVEEMSIASGIPVPDIYILDNEENINAFAAGFGTNDAAVGVTRGTLDKLNRDELQGVVAHEFSHIFNGDMKLNIRLIGILNGILLLHLMGMILMRGAAFSRIGRSGGRGRGGGGQAALAMILFGLALLIIGYIGMLFGRMIQAAISRQREYLADAAAVQYTRNPDGIAGALRKIGQVKEGGKINDGHSMEMSHLFFASSFHSALDRLFATHPPLEKRIQALDPAFDRENEKKKARLKKRLEKDRIAGEESIAGRTEGGERSPGGGLGQAAGGIEAAHPALRPEVILAAIGTLDENRISHAGKLLQNIPAKLKEAAQEPFTAEALVVALLLSGREPTAVKVPGWFRDQSGPHIAGVAQDLLQDLNKGNREWFLPLAELSLPALRQMSAGQYHKFRETVEHLIREDKNISLFEFAMEKLIVRHLDTAFSDKKEPRIRHFHFKTLRLEFSILLSAMAHSSESDPREAWQAGLESVKNLLPDDVALLDTAECTPDKLDQALQELAASADPVKKYILAALVHCSTADNRISLRERELLRAVSEAIDCPIPLGVL